MLDIFLDKPPACCRIESEHFRSEFMSYITSVSGIHFYPLDPNPKDIDIVIVPAVAFDRQCYRLGYGGGFYDRFLENYNGIKIGLTYRECVCDKIDEDENDVKMDKVIF